MPESGSTENMTESGRFWETLLVFTCDDKTKDRINIATGKRSGAADEFRPRDNELCLVGLMERNSITLTQRVERARPTCLGLEKASELGCR